MKRKLFDEIAEGFEALADERGGKRTLRTHAVEVLPPPSITAADITALRESMQLSRGVLARYLRVNSCLTRQTPLPAWRWDSWRAKPR